MVAADHGLVELVRYLLTFKGIDISIRDILKT